MAAGGADEAVAQVSGTQDAFLVGGILGLVTVACAPFVRRLKVDAPRVAGQDAAVTTDELVAVPA